MSYTQCQQLMTRCDKSHSCRFCEQTNLKYATVHCQRLLEERTENLKKNDDLKDQVLSYESLLDEFRSEQIEAFSF